MEAILDSNFVISCVRNGIDFITELEGMGFKIILPREVMQEMKDLKNNVKHDDRVAIDLAFSLFETKKVKKMTLGHSQVDLGLIHKGKKGAYIATLDAAIKRSVSNRIVINSAKNALSIERD